MSDIPNWISSLSDQEARDVSAGLSQVIGAASERVHYAENRRSNFAAIAAGLFAGAIALASMAVQDAFRSLSWSLWVLAIGFFLLSLFLFYVYSRQINRYPWTPATTTWKWFYRDALPAEANFNHSFLRWLFCWRAEVARARHEFSQQLDGFGERIRTIRDDRESLWQDIQQLYVLHVNEKYKNAYLSRLRTILSSGLALVLAAGICAAIGQHWLPRFKWDKDARASKKEAGVVLSWTRYEGAGCNKNCWLVNIRALNQSAKPLIVEIDGIGAKCLELPGVAPIGSILVEPHTVRKTSAFLACGASSPDELLIRVITDAK